MDVDEKSPAYLEDQFGATWAILVTSTKEVMFLSVFLFVYL